jgi:hypothetical protein
MSGLLGGLFSYGDGLKRKLKDVVNDPIGNINQFVGQLGDQTRANNTAMDVAGFGLGPQPTISATADTRPSIGYSTPKTVTQAQRDAAQLQVAQNASNAGIAAATVWHGSPHKFDKFDASKIGTGEGAQAYGHGLYLAESPTVATEYRNALTGNHNLDKYQFTVNGNPTDSAVAKAVVRNGSPEAFIKTMQPKLDSLTQKAAKASKEELIPGLSDYDIAMEELKSHKAMIDEARGYIGKTVKSEPLGSLYKVDLPDEHIAKMLDWDKPLSQQHPDVLSAMGYHNQPRNFEAEAKAVYGTPEYAKLEKMMDTRVGSSAVPDVTGGEWYRSTDDLLRGSNADEAGRSEYLKSLGIPGIRYLDGGSRGTGAGTSNFVVFPGNEGLLQILERNGQPMNQFVGVK